MEEKETTNQRTVASMSIEMYINDSIIVYGVFSCVNVSLSSSDIPQTTKMDIDDNRADNKSFVFNLNLGQFKFKHVKLFSDMPVFDFVRPYRCFSL